MCFRLLTELSTSDCLEQILCQLSKAILLAVKGDQTRRSFISEALRDLAKLEMRPACLTAFAYRWCSAIYENRENLEDWESLLLVCLEAGFRHLDAWQLYTDITLTHTEHHRGLVGVVFKSQESEVIADLLQAWTLRDYFSGRAGTLLDSCTGHIVNLHELVPFSPRLRRLVIRLTEIVGYKGPEGVEKFIELLDHLHVKVEDMEEKDDWMSLLLNVILSSEGTQRLSHWYWELLVELAISEPRLVESKTAYTLETMKYLTEAQEWGKLECWIGTVWMLSPGAEGRSEEVLENSMTLLFCQRPGAAPSLKRYIERSTQKCKTGIPESFESTLKRAREAAQRQVVP